MFSKQIKSGSRVAIISANTNDGPYTTRLYVNGGEDATTIVKKAKSLKGAEKQAKAMVGA